MGLVAKSWGGGLGLRTKYETRFFDRPDVGESRIWNESPRLVIIKGRDTVSVALSGGRRARRSKEEGLPGLFFLVPVYSMCEGINRGLWTGVGRIGHMWVLNRCRAD